MPDAVQPVRMRLSRRKGFELQAESRAVNGLPAVKVARPGLWGNYAAVRAGTPTGPLAVQAFERWIAEEASSAWKGRVGIDLRGKNLACWCALCPEHQRGKPVGVTCEACAPCHADVELRLANAPRCDASLTEDSSP